MQPLYDYILKLSAGLAIGYLFYYLLLRRMTYYRWNRYFLLLFPLFALVVPVLPFPGVENMQTFKTLFIVTRSVSGTAGNTGHASAQGAIDWNLVNIIITIIVLGACFFLFRLATRLYSLQRTRNSATLVEDGDIKLYELPGTLSPFSFNNSIYLDPALYSEQELKDIIAHERIHVMEHHTIDTLVSECLCVVQWFNPFAWMLKHAIRQNLEFIADDMVLQNGINRKNYQYLLLKVSGAMPYKLANNFLFPSLKKRIQMMNKTKTTKVHLLKFVCVLPLVCLLLVAFSGSSAKPGGPETISSSDNFSLSDLSFYINDEAVAALVKKEQASSFLKPGAVLSLSLISEEKKRLTQLLRNNGYENVNAHAIAFVLDTSAATKSFSVQVTIQLDQNKIRTQTQKPALHETIAASEKAVPDKRNERIALAKEIARR